jgi:hypothetical protein
MAESTRTINAGPATQRAENEAIRSDAVGWNRAVGPMRFRALECEVLATRVHQDLAKLGEFAAARLMASSPGGGITREAVHAALITELVQHIDVFPNLVNEILYHVGEETRRLEDERSDQSR